MRISVCDLSKSQPATTNFPLSFIRWFMDGRVSAQEMDIAHNEHNALGGGSHLQITITDFFVNLRRENLIPCFRF